MTLNDSAITVILLVAGLLLISLVVSVIVDVRRGVKTPDDRRTQKLGLIVFALYAYCSLATFVSVIL